MRKRECMMKHIELNAHGEAIRQFFLSLPDDPDGRSSNSTAAWSPAYSQLRKTGRGSKTIRDHGPKPRTKSAVLSIDKEIDGHLTRQEALELEGLQRQMQRHLRTLTPLPLEDARRLHEELVKKAEAARRG